MRYLLFLVAIIFFLTSCSQNSLEDTCIPNSKSQLANEISNRVALQLKKEQELYPCGFGSGMMNQIRMLALSFNYYNPIDIEQARELLIAAGNLLLKTINENEQIRPYLDTYPFQPKNIEIRIFLKPLGSFDIEGKKLCGISMLDGILEYEIHDPETKKLTTIYSETYEEAIKSLRWK
jgi:hypothetical protein